MTIYIYIYILALMSFGCGGVGHRLSGCVCHPHFVHVHVLLVTHATHLQKFDSSVAKLFIASCAVHARMVLTYYHSLMYIDQLCGAKLLCAFLPCACMRSRVMFGCVCLYVCMFVLHCVGVSKVPTCVYITYSSTRVVRRPSSNYQFW